MVGKGTRGYQQYVAMIPKEKRSARDPSTPRVAEQCSPRTRKSGVELCGVMVGKGTRGYQQ